MISVVKQLQFDRASPGVVLLNQNQFAIDQERHESSSVRVDCRGAWDRGAGGAWWCRLAGGGGRRDRWTRGRSQGLLGRGWSE